MRVISIKSQTGVVVFALALLLGAAGSSLAAETLAILPFENNSLTDAERYNPLAKGFSAMLTSDMVRKVKALKIVERTRIDNLLKEMHLGMSGAVDEESAAQAGKVLGARHIAFGTFTVLGEEVRLDIRIVRVESSALVAAESVSGRSGEILGLIAQLAGKIAASFQEGVTGEDVEKNNGGDLEAALAFSHGVEALDRGQREEAQEWFAKCLASDPEYRTHIDRLNSTGS